MLIAELTGDNRPDIFVANDGTACWLFANRGNLQFDEIGETAGVARDGQGQALAGMGVAAGDLNGDGLADLVVTNFFGRSTIAFQALANRQRAFVDASTRLGSGQVHAPGRSGSGSRLQTSMPMAGST